jgi:hypothetical protein
MEDLARCIVQEARQRPVPVNDLTFCARYKEVTVSATRAKITGVGATWLVWASLSKQDTFDAVQVASAREAARLMHVMLRAHANDDISMKDKEFVVTMNDVPIYEIIPVPYNNMESKRRSSRVLQDFAELLACPPSIVHVSVLPGTKRARQV